VFPTEPIQRYIRLASSKSTDDLTRIRATEVVEARRKLPNKSGMRLAAITQPNVNFTKSQINSWMQIVRDACKEANRPVDNEVRSYMIAEVHKMCETAKIHTAQALGLTIKQEGMQQIPGVQESLSAQFDRQISQIESEILRELKLEELREDVKKSAATVNAAPISEETPAIAPVALQPRFLPTRKKHTWTSFEKWTVFLTTIAIGLACLTLYSSHEFRVWAHIERPEMPTVAPKVVDPAPQAKPDVRSSSRLPKLKSPPRVEVKPAVPQSGPSPVPANPIGGTQTQLERLVETNQRLSESDRARLSDALYDFSTIIDQANSVWAKANRVDVDLKSNDIETRKARLNEVLALDKNYRQAFHAVRQKRHYYQEQIDYIFGDSADNDAAIVINAATDYLNFLSSVESLQGKDEKALVDLLSGEFNRYQTATTRFGLWRQECARRLQRMRDSIK
jgi:hypothetical protein